MIGDNIIVVMRMKKGDETKSSSVPSPLLYILGLLC